MTSGANIAIGLAKIGAVLRSQAWGRAETTGLSPTQADILEHLVRRGSARIGAVAEALGVTQPTVSDAVTALVRKGHVERTADPEDGRARRLHPTQAGRRLAATLTVSPDAVMGAVDALDPVEEAVFVRGLIKIVRALQERGAIPVQRMCVSCRHFRPNAHADAARPHHCVFVDAAFGDASLRLDCGDHVEADASAQLENWAAFNQAAA